MRRAAALLLATLLCGASPAFSQPHPRYVPSGVWRDARQESFMEDWFGGQLRAMHEPVLSRAGALGDYRRRFRMLVLPSFHHPYAIRLDEARDGTGHVHIVRLDGAGGYGPGNLLEKEDYRLTAAEVRPIDAAIDAAGIAAMAPQEPIPAPVATPGGGQTITVCADGVHFVFELVGAQGSRFAERSQCRWTPALEAFVRQIDGLRRTVGSDLPRYLDH